jgi:amino acid transporter
MEARQEVRPKEHAAAAQRSAASDTRSLNQPLTLSAMRIQSPVQLSRKSENSSAVQRIEGQLQKRNLRSMPSQPIKSEFHAAPRLGLWDAVSIIIGIVIGTSIFRSPPLIFQNVPGPLWAMALWLVGGVVSWCGAVCYAELATTYPRDGGDYEYLSRAFGRWSGFLFAWAQLTVIISGNIGAMAYVFADYGAEIWPAWKEYAVWCALAPIIALTLVNLSGIVTAKWAQNFLSVMKVVGLGGIVAVALFAGAQPSAATEAGAAASSPNMGIALVFVLYAFGGWVHAPYVASEVRDPHRNLPRALILGIAGITLIYLAVNASYLAVLGFDGARVTQTPASDVMSQALGDFGGRAVSLLVMLSALGAINGMILTGARVYAVWGEDFPAMGTLAKRSGSGGPIVATLIQSTIAVGLVLLVGTQIGRDFFDAALQSVGLSGLPWEKYFGGFETLVAGTAPVYWAVCLLGAATVFVLRWSDHGAVRPYRIPLFPLPPIILCASCAFLTYASLEYAKWLALIGTVPMALGGAVWLMLKGKARRH